MSEIRQIPLDAITFRPGNRHAIDEAKIRELATSIKTHGLLNAIIVRQVGKKYECVAGERRVRACRHLEHKEIAAQVIDATDAFVAEVQIVENLQREDLTPWEEAEHLAGLQKIHAGKPIEDLAALVGRSAVWVAQRLAVHRLVPNLKEHIIKQNWPLSHLPLLARVPDFLQGTLLQKIKERQGLVRGVGFAGWTEWGGGKFRPGVPSLRDLTVMLKDLQRVLAAAPWKKDDADLVPAAGACATCPKRSSKQTLLFPEITEAKDDRCLDPVCWQRKSDALVVLRTEKLRADGKKPIFFAGRHGDPSTKVIKDLGANGFEETYKYQPVKKTDPKAVPAVTVGGEKSGQVQWVRLGEYYGGSRQEKKKPAIDQTTGKPKPPSTKQRLEALTRKRQLKAVGLWVVKLEELSPRFTGMLDLLIVKFGVEETLKHRDPMDWAELKKDKAADIAKLAWEQLLPVFQNRLKIFGTIEKQAEEVWAEASSQAEALAAVEHFRACWESAVKEVPLPQTLQKEGVEDPHAKGGLPKKGKGAA